MKSHMTIALCVIATVVAGVVVSPLATRAQEATPAAQNEAAAAQDEAPAAQDAAADVESAEPRPAAKPRPAASVPPAAELPVSADDWGSSSARKVIRKEWGMPPAAHPIQEIRNAAAALRDAETDEDKAKAQQQLTDTLEKYFDEDMQRRQEELAKIEERLSKLRELLELRQAKKQEIVDLQIQVAVNEAEGLGFFSQPGNDLQLNLNINGNTVYVPAPGGAFLPPLPPTPPVPLSPVPPVTATTPAAK